MKRDLYFVNPWCDAFFMGGLSIGVYLYFQFFYRGYSNLQVSDTALAFAGMAVWVVNYPHFSATSYRFYQSAEHRRQFPLTAYLLPPMILAGTAACFVWPQEFAPAWAKMYVFWSVYHFSGQNLGLTLLYARRAGIEIGPMWRRALAWFIFGCFISQYAAVEAKGGLIWVFGVRFPLSELPLWFVRLAALFTYANGAVVAWFAWKWMRSRGPIPWIVALPLLAQVCWTQIGAQNYSFQVLLPFFHSLQYLFVAWAVEMHRRAEEPGARFELPFLSRATLRWALVNVVVGAFLFAGLPRIATLFGTSLTFNLAVFFVSVQIHHFFVDGVIWKLRGERAGSPLFQYFGLAYTNKEGR